MQFVVGEYYLEWVLGTVYPDYNGSLVACILPRMYSLWGGCKVLHRMQPTEAESNDLPTAAFKYDSCFPLEEIKIDNETEETLNLFGRED